MLSFGRRRRLGARESAEASFATTEICNGRSQVLCVEVRPQRVEEAKLGVGAFPQQEIRQTLLAAGADEKVDVRAGFLPGKRQAKALV